MSTQLKENNDLFVMLQVYVDQRTRNALRLRSIEEKKSMSEIVREILDKHLIVRELLDKHLAEVKK